MYFKYCGGMKNQIGIDMTESWKTDKTLGCDQNEVL